MAHYRKLTVDGLDWEYKIGKGFVELRRKGKEKKIVPKAEIGAETFGIVTPKMISDYIRYGKIRGLENYFPTCKCEGVEKHLVVNPYDAEIKGKKHYIYFCEQCEKEISWEI